MLLFLYKIVHIPLLNTILIMYLLQYYENLIGEVVIGIISYTWASVHLMRFKLNYAQPRYLTLSTLSLDK